MFRAAATGPYDEAVAKATDENLTSEDWAAIIEVCDKVTSDDNGPKEVVQSLIRRLAHRNANVQLYTLEVLAHDERGRRTDMRHVLTERGKKPQVAHALCQNCGKPVHREVSSRAFTDALLRLANDRNTHFQVKAKILEKMQDWSDMFSKDPDLGIMYDAYFRLKQTNPTLQPPSAPTKQGLTQADRQKEEDELQMALQLSLQEEERNKPPAAAGAAASTSGTAAAGPSSGPQKQHPQRQQQQQQQKQQIASQQSASPAPAPSAGTTAATVSRVRALYDFVPSEPGELEFKRGDVIAVLESVYKDWWRGSLKGKTGIFPLNYVEKLTDPTPEELQREAQMEAEVFAEIKNVEKLLTLLSASNTAPREEDNEEISKLYHQTLAIRPKLIKLIEKYSQRKDDFTQLNEKFIKARRDYEALLESSMSHPSNNASYAGPYGIRPAGAPPPTQGYSQGYPVGPGYAGVPPAAQDSSQQRYYTPGPQGHQGGDRLYAASPPPNFAPQGTPAPAPFYVAGAEVPSHHAQQQQQQQQYPPREEQQQPPASSPSPPLQPQQPQQPQQKQQQYVPYSQPAPSSPPLQQQQAFSGGAGRIASTAPPQYAGAQELATSVYDSPIAPHHGLQSPPTWQATAPVYSQQLQDQHIQPYGGAAAAAAAAPSASVDQVSSPPPMPTGQPPQPPQALQPPQPPQPLQPPQDGMVPLPLRPGGLSQQQEPSAPSPNDYYRSGVY
ncbi:signal transducing adaptor molecule [Geosmithia morbida]|uniref:Class E vacuolar protein-sorting machinery protein HSE1 n=1 Tax=Geosmithia morbida TaxID=1094350 RepID=A0A9P4YVX6_9HYPO|nr:signal transducing adaptor molecule [Geosmithia morbida]KAF4122696.1 signal transducing adaptor molecule [Geosmithia morbida]